MYHRMKKAPTAVDLLAAGRSAPVPLPVLPAVERCSSGTAGGPLGKSDCETLGLLPSIARRLEMIRLVIASLADRTMYLDEFTELLGCTASVARHRVKDLRRLGVLEPSLDIERTSGRRREHPYRLNGRFRYVSAESVLTIAAESPIRGLEYRRSVAQRHACGTGSSIYVHVPAEDVQAAIRTDRQPLRRDPLVAALFGCSTSFTASQK